MNWLWIILGIVGLIAIIFIVIYNRMIGLNIRCKNAWAQIDNQLKRRSDLIPNLVEVTKGYAKHETDTLIECINTRNGNIGDIAKNSEKVSNSLKTIFALGESYPDLKANELFKNLQVELTGTEDKIAFARQFYNDCVQRFNTSIEVFPNNMIVGMLKYEPKEYFEVSDSDRKLVEVNLYDNRGN